MTIHIAECPWCFSTERVWAVANACDAQVHCDKCWAIGPRGDTKKAAIKAWNKWKPLTIFLVGQYDDIDGVFLTKEKALEFTEKKYAHMPHFPPESFISEHKVD